MNTYSNVAFFDNATGLPFDNRLDATKFAFSSVGSIQPNLQFIKKIRTKMDRLRVKWKKEGFVINRK